MLGYLDKPYQKCVMVREEKSDTPPTMFATILDPLRNNDNTVHSRKAIEMVRKFLIVVCLQTVYHVRFKKWIHANKPSANARPGLSSDLMINGTRNR
jgi:hypothetical protein